MPYCGDCGGELHTCEVTAPDPAAEAARAEVKATRAVSDAEIEIARINAQRDVDVAKVQAGIMRDEAVVEAVVAEAEADATAQAIAPEPEPEPQPVMVVDADQDVTDEPSIPPAAEQGSDEPAAATSGGNPWW